MRAAFTTEGELIARLIRDLKEIAAELADDIATGDHAFWLWVDSTDLQRAYTLLETMRANIEDERHRRQWFADVKDREAL